MDDVISKYKGMCLDGPLAGFWLSHQEASFSVPLPILIHFQIEKNGEDREVVEENKPPAFCYSYQRVGDLAEFWVPSGKDDRWAMQFLVHHYRAAYKNTSMRPLLDMIGKDAAQIIFGNLGYSDEYDPYDPRITDNL